MVLVDIAVIGVLVAVFLIGMRNGVLAGFVILFGALGGAAAAAALVPQIASRLPAAAWSGPVVVLIAAAVLGLGVAAGLLLGHVVRIRVHGTHHRLHLRTAERLLGGLAAVMVGVLGLSLGTTAITLVAPPATVAAMDSSLVLQRLGGLTPAPVTEEMAELRAAMLDAGVARWAAAVSTSSHAAPALPLHLDQAALRTAAQSVVLISGTAASCHRDVTGSGFAIAPGRIVTNAHVVAGVDFPRIQMRDGSATYGRVVHFDPLNDLAVIASDSLLAAPLPLAPGLPAGALAAVTGYPLGGSLSTVPAQVLWRSFVTVPGVDGGAGPAVDVYALDADVLPGNSGGPLLTADGHVAGVVFARGEDGEGLGYAVTDALLAPLAEDATQWTRRVPTGSCAG